ncbi:solute carrier organic anion transporter family member 2B1 isoform X2 [Stigmatopora argus]
MEVKVRNRSVLNSVKTFVALHSVLQMSLLLVSGYMKSSISTIERRYGLSSQKSGLLAAFNEVGNTLLIVFVSFLGSRVHRPRVIGLGALLACLASLLMALPHFLSGPYRYGRADRESGSRNVSGLCRPDGALDAPSSNGTCERPADLAHRDVYPLLLLAQLLLGVASVPVQPFGISYIDDHASRKNSPLYLGIVLAVTAIGPALGFLSGAFMLRLYVDLDKMSADEVELDGGDLRWVGAWWLGFLVASCLLFLAALPYFFFPRTMSPEDQSGADESGVDKSGADESGVDEKLQLDIFQELGLLHFLKSGFLFPARPPARRPGLNAVPLAPPRFARRFPRPAASHPAQSGLPPGGVGPGQPGRRGGRHRHVHGQVHREAVWPDAGLLRRDYRRGVHPAGRPRNRPGRRLRAAMESRHRRRRQVVRRRHLAQPFLRHPSGLHGLPHAADSRDLPLSASHAAVQLGVPLLGGILQSGVRLRRRGVHVSVSRRLRRRGNGRRRPSGELHGLSLRGRRRRMGRARDVRRRLRPPPVALRHRLGRHLFHVVPVPDAVLRHDPQDGVRAGQVVGGGHPVHALQGSRLHAVPGALRPGHRLHLRPLGPQVRQADFLSLLRLGPLQTQVFGCPGSLHVRGSALLPLDPPSPAQKGGGFPGGQRERLRAGRRGRQRTGREPGTQLRRDFNIFSRLQDFPLLFPFPFLSRAVPARSTGTADSACQLTRLLSVTL